MKAPVYTQVIVSIIFFLVACTARTSEPTITAEYGDEQLALQTLIAFLDNLHNGQYETATQLYGGKYETMIDQNPSIDPSNQVALMENACKINGAVCLEVKSAALDKKFSAIEFSFKVEFLNADGSLFMRGPCCGGNETDFPPQSTFMFTVMKDSEGKFLVMDMPPYMP